MLSIFGDESADETKQRVFAVAGLIANEQLWGALEAKWLARTGGIPFHAKDCDSDHNSYANSASFCVRCDPPSRVVALVVSQQTPVLRLNAYRQNLNKVV
jgi:hypothetical protein